MNRTPEAAIAAPIASGTAHSSTGHVAASLAADIVDGSFVSRDPRHRKVCLAYVLDVMLDEPLLDSDDTASLIAGDTETRMNILDRAERTATEIVTRWLTDEAEGRALVADVAEAERIEAAEYEEHMERSAA